MTCRAYRSVVRLHVLHFHHPHAHFITATLPLSLDKILQTIFPSLQIYLFKIMPKKDIPQQSNMKSDRDIATQSSFKYQ